MYRIMEPFTRMTGNLPIKFKSFLSLSLKIPKLFLPSLTTPRNPTFYSNTCLRSPGPWKRCSCPLNFWWWSKEALKSNSCRSNKLGKNRSQVQCCKLLKFLLLQRDFSFIPPLFIITIVCLPVERS